jgi:hypothetical protein
MRDSPLSCHRIELVSYVHAGLGRHRWHDQTLFVDPWKEKHRAPSILAVANAVETAVKSQGNENSDEQ